MIFSIEYFITMGSKDKDLSGMSNVSRRIYDELIDGRQLNPNRIAKDIGVAGNSVVEQWFYGVIKKGKRTWATPKIDALEKIENTYGLSVHWILYGKGEKYITANVLIENKAEDIASEEDLDSYPATIILKEKVFELNEKLQVAQMRMANMESKLLMIDDKNQELNNEKEELKKDKEWLKGVVDDLKQALKQGIP